MTDRALIVGSIGEPHVKAVQEACEQNSCGTLLIDAERLASSSWELRGPDLDLRLDEHRLSGRGWLRRLAPPLTHSGIQIGSLDAAEASSRLLFLAALSSSPITWLTDYWALMRAENKLIQYRTAGQIGIPVPRFEVVSHASLISGDLGDRFIVKPLGLGEYRTDSETYAVHSNVLDRGDPRLTGLSEAPFLIQALVEARTHLRVVTVVDRAWSASLDAQRFPVDWRLDPEAHASWTFVSSPEVERQALRLSGALGLGFSSQDWIIDVAGQAWFIDGNPAGQWLFLPAETCEPATDAIASWLTSGGCSE